MNYVSLTLFFSITLSFSLSTLSLFLYHVKTQADSLTGHCRERERAEESKSDLKICLKIKTFLLYTTATKKIKSVFIVYYFFSIISLDMSIQDIIIVKQNPMENQLHPIAISRRTGLPSFEQK